MTRVLDISAVLIPLKFGNHNWLMVHWFCWNYIFLKVSIISEMLHFRGRLHWVMDFYLILLITMKLFNLWSTSTSVYSLNNVLLFPLPINEVGLKPWHVTLQFPSVPLPTDAFIAIAFQISHGNSFLMNFKILSKQILAERIRQNLLQSQMQRKNW